MLSPVNMLAFPFTASSEKYFSGKRKIFDMFYVQGLKAPACSEILGCNKSKFYQMKEELVKELERKLNEDEAHSDL